jgi:hypothetical protein
MKSGALLVVGLGILIADASPPHAKASIVAPRDHAIARLASKSTQGVSPVNEVKVADDYCNSRCEQQFNYCQYRGASLEHCTRALIICRKDC